MARDTLYLIGPGFTYPKQPRRGFVCPHLNQAKAVPAAFPEWAAKLDVHHMPFPHRRRKVTKAIGGANRSLPALAHGDDPPAANSRSFTAGTSQIPALPAERDGFPHLHG